MHEPYPKVSLDFRTLSSGTWTQINVDIDDLTFKCSVELVEIIDDAVRVNLGLPLKRR